MRLFIIGFMGSGKSTLGRQLAARLGLTFIDMDKFIEKRYFKTVSQLFADEGEECFRKKERVVLEELAGYEKVVVATGGGTPCFGDNMALMNQHGKTIFLDISAETLVARLYASKTDRPLINEKSREELTAYVENLLNQRCPYYQQATHTVSGDAICVEDILGVVG